MRHIWQRLFPMDTRRAGGREKKLPPSVRVSKYDGRVFSGYLSEAELGFYDEDVFSRFQ